MQRIHVEDTELSVQQEGQGPPLLFVHGFPFDHRMWESQVAEFREDYHVIAPDLRGFGASGLGRETISMARLADDLAVMLDSLQVERPVVFCGLSMGGYIGWQFWDRHPDRVERFVLCDTRAAADSAEAAKGRRQAAARVKQEGGESLVEGMLPKLFANSTFKTKPELVQTIRRLMDTTDPRTIAAALIAMAQRPDMEPRLHEIAVPTLLLGGQEDVITPVDEMRRVAEAMPAAEFLAISAAGHMAPVEQPVAVNRAIRRFLTGQV